MPILYTVDIPKPTDQIAQSQGQLRNNNNALNEWVNVNHGSFNTANFGKHLLATFPNLAAPPAPAGNDLNIYNALSDGIPQFFVERTGEDPVPMTKGNNSSTTGYFYVPSGYIVQWGFTTVNGTGIYNITFPFPNAGLFGMVTPRANMDPNNIISFSSFPAGPNVSTFTAVSNQITGFNFWYLLIGF